MLDYIISILESSTISKDNSKKQVSKSDYNDAIKVANKILQKYPTMKKAFRTVGYNTTDVYSIKILEYDTWRIKWSGSGEERNISEYEKLFKIPFENFCKDMKNELKKYNLKIDGDGDEEYGFIYIECI